MKDEITISEERLRDIMREELHHAFRSIGIDPDDTLENQKDMVWLRAWRNAVTATGSRAGLTIVSILVTGLVGLVAVALGIPRSWFGL